MLIASMIALARNLPIADIDGFAAGRLFGVGNTRDQRAFNADDIRHALVVDDSSRTGSSMVEAIEKLDAVNPSTKITTCVAYGAIGLAQEIDIVMEMVPEPRVFEWNVMHHPVIERACLDIDGVLCLDPAKNEQEGGAYERFLTNAIPLHLPEFTIGTLVTSRLEKYRAQTEDWLGQNGVRYGELCMLDLPDAASRRRLRAHAPFKAEVYAFKESPLFVESETLQAKDIALMSGKPVLSLEDSRMFQPGVLNPSTIRHNIRSKVLLKQLTKAMLGPARVMQIKRNLKA